MTAVVRGHPTAPTAIPSRWRGPLPDVSIQRRLDGLDGYAEVPLSLLHGNFSDLAVLVWAQLRLWFDDREGKTSYYELAEALGVDSASPSAVKAKFSAAVQPLLGTWIERRRVTENQFAYRAVMHGTRERYAMIRRCDLALLSNTAGTRQPVKPADIADFGRWQLECGQRGWTAETAAAIAERWHVTPPTIRASRKRLESLGLLKVTARDRRLSELTWLQELYDPHWTVPSQTVIEPRAGLEDEKKNLTLGSEGSEKKPDLGGEKNLTLVGKKTWPPIEELSDSLTDVLTDLGGTSVPPPTSPPRELRGAPPPASRAKSSTNTSASRLAGKILGGHRFLASAPKHYRAAMRRRLSTALAQGLEPEHAARAVARVVEEGEIEHHCEVLRQALQQAWADHHAGMCVECGELQGRHALSCSHDTGESAVPDTSVDGLGQPLTPAAWQPAVRPAQLDHLQVLLDQPVGDPTTITDDAGAVAWICHELAGHVAQSADQHAALQALWRDWRQRLPGRSHLVDQAVEHVRYALDQRRVS